MTSVVGFQLDGNELGDQITKLFPKCRPRDLNLNPVSHDDHLDNNIFVMDLDKDLNRCSTERDDCLGDEDEEDMGSQDNESTSSSDDFNNEEDLVIDHTSSGPEGQVIVLQSSKGATYKLRDSRIIEIAGGRELFSQSRTKALRNKPRCNNELNVEQVVLDREKPSSKANARKSPMNQNVWELTPGAAEQGKKQTREITETVFSTEIHSVKHERSSIPQGNSASGVVVFDDIGDGPSWRRRLESERVFVKDTRKDSAGSSPSPPSYHQTPSDFFKVTSSMHDLDGSTGKMAGDLDKGPQVIGGLAIAEYEGSPRRYGPRIPETHVPSHPLLPSAHSLLASPSVYTPKPGFPQRVVPASTEQQQSPPQQQQQQSQQLSDSKAPSPNQTVNSTFDYLYEFSETRKVLEEFFKHTDSDPAIPELQNFDELGYELRRQTGRGSAYVGLRLAKGLAQEQADESPQKLSNSMSPGLDHQHSSMRDHDMGEHESNFLDLSADSASTEDLGDTEVGLQVGHSRNFTLSPETTDCDSNCGDLDSEVSLLLMETDLADGQPVQGNGEGLDMSSLQTQDSLRVYSSMPILEDGLSSGHASDTDNNNPTMLLMKRQITEIEREIVQRSRKLEPATSPVMRRDKDKCAYGNDPELEALDPLNTSQATPPPPAPVPHRSMSIDSRATESVEAAIKDIRQTLQRTKTLPLKSPTSVAEDLLEEHAASSPVWVPRRRTRDRDSVERRSETSEPQQQQQEEEEADTDLETDRLLGQQRTDDQGFYDDKAGWKRPKTRTVIPSSLTNTNKTSTPLKPQPPLLVTTPSHEPPALLLPLSNETPAPQTPGTVDSSPDKSPSPTKDSSAVAVASRTKKEKEGGKKKGRNKEVLIHEPSVLIEGVLFRARYLGSTQLVCEGQPTKSTRMIQAEEAVSRIKADPNHVDLMTPPPLVAMTNLGPSGPVTSVASHGSFESDDNDFSDTCEPAAHAHARPHGLPGPLPLPLGIGAVGTVFRLVFLGSVEVEEEGGRKRRQRHKKHMVEEAVTKIKAPEGETQPSTEVDLFISTEKIMVLNTDLKEIMMDHALRTISYIADIGDLVVLMARRRYVPHDVEESAKLNRTPKMICHVFESEEAQFIAQSIGQAFQVAYMEFLKANGIEDHSFVKEMDYQEVLNSQEIFGDELQMFAKKEMQKEVVVPKAKGEILGVVIVESGWGSMLPTVVIANLAPAGAAARCGQLNIGDQIIAINGISLVGLPLSTCQTYIKNTKNQTVVKLTVVPCAPVVEVKIKRPDTKYQLGFSVQNGVICSLLRGGIAERGGVRVGHRIIEINNQSVVAVPHERIVNLLATSVGEILMKTMPTSMFRLLTGQETPLYI